MIIKFKVVNVALTKENIVVLTLNHIELEEILELSSKTLDNGGNKIFGVDMSNMVAQVVSKMGYPSLDDSDKINSDLIISLTEYEELGKPTVGEILKMELNK